ncbi:uncharacterized protein LOC131019797 [Salvia miltiorrhiza]|uniref:uncharacterized protein LOC131019797 n=1 Tax=Salvia miltiorrhiza TaxID=226208 RepID=UPI0025AD7EB1|nr:uncharacterized protein LOC131019797 [Salvia miltiorrhiza]
MTAEANSWFASLSPYSITTWAEMKKLFLEHFFPPTKTNALKKEISGVKQEYDESLSTYWTRFRRLVDSCPNHKFSEGDLLQYFYQGMTVDTKNLVNSSSGGAFSQNTVSEAKRLIQHLVEATREYEEPRIQLLKKAAQASSSDFEDKFEERMGRMERLLSTVVEKVANAGQPTEKPCGACGNFGHTSLQCAGGDRDLQAQVNSSHNFYSCSDPLHPLPKRDPYSSNYNAPWRDHPNDRWRDQSNQVQQQQQGYRPPHQRGFQQAPSPPQENQGKALEEMMRELIGSQQLLQNNLQTTNEAVLKLQQSQTEQRVQIEGLARQVSQLATSVNQLKGHQGKLPSQVQLNPRENVSMITLRSGKELSEPTTQNSKECPSKNCGVKFSVEKFENSGGKVDSAIQNTEQFGLAKQTSDPTAGQKEQETEHKVVKGEQSKVHKPSSLHDPEIEIPVPFPRRLAKKKPEEELMDFMRIFGKLEINLPFLQTLKLPQLSKFLKDFIAGKSKKSGKIVMSENVSAVIRKELPPKCKDPGSGHTDCLPKRKPRDRNLHFDVEPPDLKDKCVDELRLEAYDAAMWYKDRTKMWHDKNLQGKTFTVGQKVLLFQSKLRLMTGKLKTKWIGPFVIQSVCQTGRLRFVV